MKKIFTICAVFAALSLFVGCASTDVEVDKSVLTTVEENYDFIYEVVNNSSEKLLVAPYIKRYYSENVNKILANTSEVIVIETGSSYQFKYNLKTLKKLYGSSSFIGANFSREGQWTCYGWENDFNVENQKHIIKISDSVDSQYPIDGKNEWDYINIGLLEQNESDYDFIYEVVNNMTCSLTVAPYLKNYNTGKFVAKTSNVVLEKGETYQFKFKLEDVKSQFGKSLSLGSFFTPEYKWRCYGWENDLNSKNKKHTVVCTDAAPEYCLEGENKWSKLE